MPAGRATTNNWEMLRSVESMRKPCNGSFVCGTDSVYNTHHDTCAISKRFETPAALEHLSLLPIKLRVRHVIRNESKQKRVSVNLGALPHHCALPARHHGGMLPEILPEISSTKCAARIGARTDARIDARIGARIDARIERTNGRTLAPN